MIGCQVNIRVLQSIKGFGMAQLVAAFVLFAHTFTGAWGKNANKPNGHLCS